jgi:chorismate--pyruvate lyase
MTECFLTAADICKLNRDLRLLIGTNGTLTRILGIVADEEIFVQIINQKIHLLAPEEAPLPG